MRRIVDAGGAMIADSLTADDAAWVVDALNRAHEEQTDYDPDPKAST